MAKKTQKPEYLSFAVSQVGVFPKRPDMKSWKSKMQTSKIPREKSKNTKHNNIPDVLEVKIQNETIFELFLIFACLTAKTSGILFCFVFFVFCFLQVLMLCAAGGFAPGQALGSRLLET